MDKLDLIRCALYGRAMGHLASLSYAGFVHYQGVSLDPAAASEITLRRWLASLFGGPRMPENGQPTEEYAACDTQTALAELVGWLTREDAIPIHVFVL